MICTLASHRLTLRTSLTCTVVFLLSTACQDSRRRSAARNAVGDSGVVSRQIRHEDAVAGKVTTNELLAHGRELFSARFNTLDGAGRPGTTGTGSPRPTRSAPQNFNRVSAPDANSCAGCHNLPFAGGGGDNVANVFVMGQRMPHLNFDAGAGDNFKEHSLREVANERATIGMLGSGYIELLAREITAELHSRRDQAVRDAASQSKAVTIPLVAKGIDYGFITAQPSGDLDTSRVSGLDSDLIVKPFHQKGVVTSLRQFTNNALNHHHGMQSTERFGKGVDADGDNHRDELIDGDVTALTLWQAALPVPGRVWPGIDGPERRAAERGETLFASIGCAGCHVPELRLNSPMFSEPNPYNPAGNLRLQDVSAPLAIDLTIAGPGPHLPKESNGSVIVHAYTDLKRHDMGPQLNNERLEQDGVPTSHFLTKKLWGAVSEPPYLHHGRATTLDEAIRLHGGESTTSRDNYSNLSTADRDAVVEFLHTLQAIEPGSKGIEIVGAPSGFVGDEPARGRINITQQDIVAGRVSAEELFEAGKKLFGASFNTLDGAGRPNSTGTGAPRERREFPENFNRFSGPDANSCAGCHNLPSIGGAGENVGNVFVMAQRLPHVNFDAKAGDGFSTHFLENVGNERNTPPMWGSGYIELLAREITNDLQAHRAGAMARRRVQGGAERVELASKGISFGTVEIDARGIVDTGALIGVDQDLVVKPFHQKGVVVSLRQFTNNALNHHHGMQSSERFGKGVDADQDGMANEFSEGDVSAMTVFQALMAAPHQELPKDARQREAVLHGERVFERVGCTECHVPSLPLQSSLFTEPNPNNPAGNLRAADGRSFAIDLNKHGPAPRLAAVAGKTSVPAYTDFRRHDMGPECNNEKLVQGGVPTSRFLTARLWGVADSAPYLHHGRALTLTEAIELHGGDSAGSRAQWRALGQEEKDCLIDFLRSLRAQ